MANALSKHASRMLLVLALAALLPLTTWAKPPAESAPPVAAVTTPAPSTAFEVEPPTKNLEVKRKKQWTIEFGPFTITITETICEQGTNGCEF